MDYFYEGNQFQYEADLTQYILSEQQKGSTLTPAQLKDVFDETLKICEKVHIAKTQSKSTQTGPIFHVWVPKQ